MAHKIASVNEPIQPPIIITDNLSTDSTNLVHFTSVATLPSKGSVKLVSSVLSLNDAISKGLGFLYQISKHNQHRETKLQVPHYLLLVSSPPAQSPEFCILVTGKCNREYVTVVEMFVLKSFFWEYVALYLSRVPVGRRESI